LNKALLDTDIYSEIIKSVDPNVTRNATTYRQYHGILTLSAVTVMEVVRGFQRNQSQRKLQSFPTRGKGGMGLAQRLLVGNLPRQAG
jgi:predicted nucleic acid-binding protein